MILPSSPIYSSLGADPDFADLVEWYVAEMSERIINLQALFAVEAWEELRRVTHQVKGAAGSYGFPQLTPAAGRLEHSLMNACPEAQIEAELDALVSLCAALRAGAPAPEAQQGTR